jgi:hypothetical protein
MNRRAWLKMNMLVQESQTQASSTNDIASIRRLIATNESENCSFTCSVPTHETNVLARVYLQ